MPRLALGTVEIEVGEIEVGEIEVGEIELCCDDQMAGVAATAGDTLCACALTIHAIAGYRHLAR
jgi:hypothetical protein